MSNKYKNIGIVGLSNNPKIPQLIESIVTILTSEKREVLIDRKFESLVDLTNINYVTKKEIQHKCDLVISLGGDGTMLESAKNYGIEGIPLLGVNLGSLGFLTDIAPEDIEKELKAILNSELQIDERFFIKAKIDNKELDYKALNEIVIHSGAIAQMIEFTLFVDDQFVCKQRADGLIISTPTGSTAYSLSGGGPIIHPELDIILILPIFPQSLNSSPIIVDANKEIKIVLSEKQKIDSAEISFDSQENISLSPNSIIDISKHSSKLLLLHPKNHDFFSGCRDKLGWGKSII
ncbi:MAG: NAD(+) kinase [SAR86 cluster bacterium]|jgi:NAD+ kinase|nr:NAD(+) kinase [SAR86 cluster bacterium]